MCADEKESGEVFFRGSTFVGRSTGRSGGMSGEGCRIPSVEVEEAEGLSKDLE